jgi:hypothetical protein
MILLIVIPIWILAVSMIAGLCAAARRGDIEHAITLSGYSREDSKRERRPPRPALGSRHVGARRSRSAESSVLAHSSKAAA